MKEPVFLEPWHAQIFALTVHLSETGVFSWPDWAQGFGAVLAEQGLDKELDGGEDYFLAWVEALERLLTARGLAGAADLARLKSDWEAAYLATPHGQPVRLAQRS
ncbi:nitrile hydratase accessory protein [Puniceibacterium sediminis]|uniref:Nitrile hydratase accessory protein n=1 Tax=Puniceibacterium sediminis TaxID=1608407 RepID=A0A238UXQ2_9RHOB|nr:nitrile hydratase accessory protein [Puniceibacterium sediminis]SNR26049.1 nitrile hydratase accessory protein [Puniceibacterium sediminis]